MEMKVYDCLSEPQSVWWNVAAKVTEVRKGEGWQEPGHLHWDSEGVALDSIGNGDPLTEKFYALR